MKTVLIATVAIIVLLEVIQAQDRGYNTEFKIEGGRAPGGVAGRPGNAGGKGDEGKTIRETTRGSLDHRVVSAIQKGIQLVGGVSEDLRINTLGSGRGSFVVQICAGGICVVITIYF